MNKLLLPAGLLIIMLMFNACMVHLPREYDILDINGKRETTVQKNTGSYNELTNKGFVSYIEFSRISGDKYSQISIALYTLKKYKSMKIHSLEFEFEDKKETARINKTIKLRQEERLFSVEDNNELSVTAYFEYIYRDINKIKLYMQNVFNKNDEDIGKTIELTLKANYSFDYGGIVTQEIKYRVSILEGGSELPSWMYRLFPEM